MGEDSGCPSSATNRMACRADPRVRAGSVFQLRPKSPADARVRSRPGEPSSKARRYAHGRTERGPALYGSGSAMGVRGQVDTARESLARLLQFGFDDVRAEAAARKWPHACFSRRSANPASTRAGRQTRMTDTPAESDPQNAESAGPPPKKAPRKRAEDSLVRIFGRPWGGSSAFLPSTEGDASAATKRSKKRD